MREERRPERVIVVGAGVSGLTCGIALRREGLPVTIRAAETCDGQRAPADGTPPPPMASPWAAAIWYPYHCEPAEKVTHWAGETLSELRKISKEHADSGVSMVQFDVYYDEVSEAKERPLLDKYVGADCKLELKAPQEPIPSGCSAGVQLTVPLMDTLPYLRFLMAKFREEGGTLELEQVKSLDCEPGVTVVNCAGLGARTLSPETDPGTGKPLMTGGRGQVLWVRLKDPLERRVVALREGLPPVYVIRRGENWVLGGTDDEVQIDEPNSLALRDPDEILKRCAEMVSEIGAPLERREQVGLRPVRKGGVRLESEQAASGGLIVHNYGHGGGGFTVSWGCAAEVVDNVLGREMGETAKAWARERNS